MSKHIDSEALKQRITDEAQKSDNQFVKAVCDYVIHIIDEMPVTNEEDNK